MTRWRNEPRHYENEQISLMFCTKIQDENCDLGPDVMHNIFSELLLFILQSQSSAPQPYESYTDFNTEMFILLQSTGDCIRILAFFSTLSRPELFFGAYLAPTKSAIEKERDRRRGTLDYVSSWLVYIRKVIEEDRIKAMGAISNRHTQTHTHKHRFIRTPDVLDNNTF